MRLFVSLSALLISSTLLVVYSTSFSTAELNNETALTIAPEQGALIAISYGQKNKVAVTNNTDKTITIESVSIISDSNHKITTQGKEGPVTLSSGSNQVYNITGKPQQLPGKVIVVKAHWNGGSAEIKSTIPNNFTTQDGLEEETVNEQPMKNPKSEEDTDGLEEDLSESEEGDKK